LPESKLIAVLELLGAAGDGSTSLEAWLGRLVEPFAAERVELCWPHAEPLWRLAQDRGGAEVEPLAPEPFAARMAEARGGVTTAAAADGACWLVARVPLPGGGPAVLGLARARTGADWTAADRLALGAVAQALGRSDLLADRLNDLAPQRDQAWLGRRLQDAAAVSGRVAHDFDNLLTGILGFAELTLPSLTPGSPPHQFISELLRVGQTGTKITQQLHQFSRSGASRPRPGSLATALRAEVERVRPLLGPDRSADLDLAEELPPAALDADGLRQVFGHLLDNACEALPAGPGSVSVTARTVELSPDEARTFWGQAGPGPHLEVVVSDTGSGMTPESRRRLLVEPFFSTKPRHRGLGLVVCYRILSANKAGFTITSAPGAGTTVRVVLPAAPTPRGTFP
jgi:signal transduction histidine kinase